MQIEKHKVATIDYTLTNNTGEVLDSSEGQEPMTYIQGVGSLITGLEAALEGKSAGEELQVTLSPEKAYGERDESLVQVVERSAFEGVEELETGMQFQARSNTGQTQLICVTQIDGDEVTVDGNHPLAGETLHFDVTVVEVREATEEELNHGHAHGAGGHQH